MMPRIYPLFSSSKGNSTYVGSAESGVLIDCGVSYTKIKNAMELNKLDLSCIKAVFITHEHSDHINGLKVFTKKTGIPVFAQSMTLDILYDNGMIHSSAEDIKETVEISGLSVSCFNTSHDTAESCGYRISFPDGKSCCICTDLGYVSDIVMNAAEGCNAILLEANYDEEMLRNGSYPAYLKSRIRSKCGHLSNNDCGKFASFLISRGTERIILGHLSQENNTPETAEYTVESIIAKSGFQRNRDYILSCAPVEARKDFVAF